MRKIRLKNIRKYLAYYIFRSIRRHKNDDMIYNKEEMEYSSNDYKIRQFLYVNKENFNLSLTIKDETNKIISEVKIKSSTFLVSYSNSVISINLSKITFNEINYIVKFVGQLIYCIDLKTAFDKLNKFEKQVMYRIEEII